MTTPSGYPGSGKEPYGSAGQYPGGPGTPGSYPPPAQYPAAQYPPAGPDQYGQYPPQQFGGPAPYPGPSQYPSPAGARPGMVTAAAVLAFVVSGLIILVGLVTLLAGSALSGYIGGLGGIVIFFAILFMAIGALYIWAGILALQGKNAMFLTIIAGVAAVLQLLSLFSEFSAGTVAALAVSVAIIALLLQEQSKTWFKSRGAPSF